MLPEVCSGLTGGPEMIEKPVSGGWSCSRDCRSPDAQAGLGVLTVLSFWPAGWTPHDAQQAELDAIPTRRSGAGAPLDRLECTGPKRRRRSHCLGSPPQRPTSRSDAEFFWDFSDKRPGEITGYMGAVRADGHGRIYGRRAVRRTAKALARERRG